MDAPFRIGQKVICLKSFGDILIKDRVYHVAEQLYCERCNVWYTTLFEIIGHHDSKGFHCAYCCELLRTGPLYKGVNSKFFAPIDEQHADLTKEIAEQFKETSEQPDIKQIPVLS